MACVLIIDDNDLLLQSLDFYLRAVGHTVLKAMDGASGLKLFAENRVDIVILDFEIPPTSGMVLCQIIKKDPAHSRLPVIMMSGRGMGELTAEAKAAGISIVLDKPFDMKLLAATIARLLSPEN